MLGNQEMKTSKGRSRRFSRVAPIAILAMVTSLLAGCYETRTTLTVNSTSNASMTHEHFVYVDAFGGNNDTALQFVENLYPNASGNNISKDGYVGKRYSLSSIDAINAFRTDEFDKLTVVPTQLDGQTVLRVRLGALFRRVDNPAGYRKPVLQIRYPSNWTVQIDDLDGGTRVNTGDGLTLVGPDIGNVWFPDVYLKPPAITRVDDGPEIGLVEGDGEEPDLEVLEPELPEVDIIEPGDAGEEADAPSPTGDDAGDAGDEANAPGPTGDDAGDLGNPGGFDDLYGDGGAPAPSGELPGDVDFADLYGNDGDLPTIEELAGADTAAEDTPGGLGMLGGIFTGLALGGAASGVIVFVVRRKTLSVATGLPEA